MVGVKRKILIVDDEAAVRDLFASTLEPGGFDVVGVADPGE
jgi:CheY-like chemotaxis protein